MDLSKARARSRIQHHIRSFFSSKGYTEVETPILSPGVIPESPIEYFETHHYGGDTGDYPLYLLPSPELYMKKLLARGSGDIFQIVRSFRNGEERGGLHNPEFSMLEWYSTFADYHDSIGRTEELFSYLLENLQGDEIQGEEKHAKRLRPPFRTMSVRNAVKRYAGVDLLDHQNRSALAGTVEKLGLRNLARGNGTEEESWEQLFNRIFIHFVEPNLPKESPTILYDYPAQIPALAKRHTEGPWLERWELYIGDLELANCYSEETEGRLIRDFFEREAAAKAMDSPIVPDIDGEFPECSGVAMGVDRLVMLLTGASSIEGVILFPFSDIIRR